MFLVNKSVDLVSCRTAAGTVDKGSCGDKQWCCCEPLTILEIEITTFLHSEMNFGSKSRFSAAEATILIKVKNLNQSKNTSLTLVSVDYFERFKPDVW